MLSPSSTLSIEVVQGRALKRLLRAASPTERALLAADLEAGRVIVERPTARQARALTGAPIAYAYAARRLSPIDRSAVRGGRLKLSELARRRRDLTDDRLQRIISAAGPGRVMQILDKMTAPQLVAAE